MKLTQDSTKLVEITQHELYQRNVKVSENVNNIIKKILIKLNEFYESYDERLINNINYTLLRNFNPNLLIPYNILENIRTKCVHYYKLELRCSDTLYITHLHFITKPTNKKIETIYKKIYIILNLLNTYSSYSGTINLYIYFTHFKKKFTKEKKLDVENINTAYTLGNIEIHIFRNEEWFKVLIHEVFHATKLDFSSVNPQNMSTDFIYQLLKLKIDDVRIYESYSETWAVIIHTIYLSFMNTRDKYNSDLIMNKFDKFINHEISWSLLQMNKILKHNNLKYSSLINKSDNTNYDYTENTYIVSYFIIKMILFFNLNSFIEWCFNVNKGIKFNTNEINSFFKFIYTHHNNETFIKHLNHVEKVKLTEYAKNSLRMSIYEIE